MNLVHASIRSACSAQAVCASPLGPILLARTPSGLAGAWFDGQRHHPPELDAPHRTDDPLLARVAEQIGRYFAGTLPAFDVPFDLCGTPFQRSVWQALLAIGTGTTCSYADIARAIGRPGAGRAVGAAVGRNPVSILVPCHRVVGSDGTLTGYAGGIERKRALLLLEAAGIATARAASASATASPISAPAPAPAPAPASTSTSIPASTATEPTPAGLARNSPAASRARAGAP